MTTLTLVGSRKAPFSIRQEAMELGKAFSDLGYKARSGGALGMDTYWLYQYDPELATVYRHDDKPYDARTVNTTRLDAFDEAIDIINRVVPHIACMDDTARLLHYRNAFQVLGDDLRSPSDYLIYWSPMKNDVPVGGTKTAVLLAKRVGIPVLHLEHDRTGIYKLAKLPYSPPAKFDIFSL